MHIVTIGNLIVRAVCQRPLHIVAVRPLYHRLRSLRRAAVLAVCDTLHRKGADVLRRDYYLDVARHILVDVIQSVRTCHRKDHAIGSFLSYLRHKIKLRIVRRQRPRSF